MSSNQSGYGGFPGGDPRKFWPDPEVCTEAEMAAHREACQTWNEAEARGEKIQPEPNDSGWICTEDGKQMYHVSRSRYGLGIYEYTSKTCHRCTRPEEDCECSDADTGH